MIALDLPAWTPVAAADLVRAPVQTPLGLEVT
jgi:hypothetical protein